LSVAKRAAARTLMIALTGTYYKRRPLAPPRSRGSSALFSSDQAAKAAG
jgi:hypothetical protein